jgi:hypothetical protein
MIIMADATQKTRHFFATELFCERCGMRLRASPARSEYKEKVRAKKKMMSVVVSYNNR